MNEQQILSWIFGPLGTLVVMLIIVWAGQRRFWIWPRELDEMKASHQDRLAEKDRALQECRAGYEARLSELRADYERRMGQAVSECTDWKQLYLGMLETLDRGAVVAEYVVQESKKARARSRGA